MDCNKTPDDRKYFYKQCTPLTECLSLEETRGSIDGRATDTDEQYGAADGWQINQTLGQCMLQLFDAQLWTDVVFRCVDQREGTLRGRVCAHKIVLAARSPVFQSMFFGEWQDGNTEIELRATDIDVFVMFIRCLYSDDVGLYTDYEDLVHILEIAHRYQVQVIVDGCCRKLIEKVSVDNACDLLDRALLYGHDYLVSHVSDFIDHNAESVLVTDGYLEMSSRCLTYILKGNTFHAKEADIFTRTIEWAKQRCDSANGQIIRKTLGEAFYFLRTPTMTNVEFVICTNKKGYYSLDEYEDIIASIVNFETSRLEVGCNSNVPRCSFPFITKRPQRTSLTDVGYADTITEELTLVANENIFLTSIQLSKQNSVFHLKEGNRSSVDNEFVLTNLPLSVTVAIDSGSVHRSKYTMHAGSSSAEIQLQQPVPLSSGQSYELEVNLSLEAIQGLKLRAYSCKTADIFIGCDSSKVCVKTKEDRTWGPIRNAEVIESLTFKCMSKRD